MTSDVVCCAQRCGCRSNISKGHVTKAAGTPIRPSKNHGIYYGTMSREVLAKMLGGGLVGETANKDLPWMTLVFKRGTVGNRVALFLLGARAVVLLIAHLCRIG
jgi:hypothetical protein